MSRARASALTAAVVATLVGALLSPRPAAATCTDPLADTYLDTTAVGSGTALGPAVSHPELGVTLVASNSTLYVLDMQTWTRNCSVALSGNIQNSPVPVRLNDGSWAAFVGTLDGAVWRIDPSATGGGACPIVWQRSIARPGCSDGVSATPAVHLLRYASDTFKAKYTTDLVYAATHYLDGSVCSGQTTKNKVYAFQASDGLPVWTFNETEALSIDYFAQAGYLDYEHDAIYLASARGGGISQHTLWAVDVLTGAKTWSTGVGAVSVMPMVVGDRIYVANSTGAIKAVSRLDGAVAWSLASGDTSITNNIFAERRPPFAGLIAVVGAKYGLVHLIQDNGASGAKVWDAAPGATLAKSRVALNPETGKLLVGGADGRVYQMNLTDGSTEIYRTVDPVAKIVGDPGFVFEDTNGDGSYDEVRLVVGTDRGTITKFCGPWASGVAMMAPGAHRNRTCNSDADCGGTALECGKYACIQRVCTVLPANEGWVGCDTRNQYTKPGTCTSGTCVGKSECEQKFDTCTCQESTGEFYPRQFHPGQAPENTSFFTTTNSCLMLGTSARTVVELHLVDDKGRPFTGANVTLSLAHYGEDLPAWVDPSTGNLLTTNIITTNDYVVRSARPGTYFGILAPFTNGVPNQGFDVSSSFDLGTCLKGGFTTRMRMVAAPTAGSGGCSLLSEKNESRYLRVKVLRADTRQPLSKAWVMVGYKRDLQKFTTDFERYITGGAGNASNVGQTDTTGIVEFNDLGDGLNGPFIVTAGRPPLSGYGFATVTMQQVADSDVTLTLPVIPPTSVSRQQKGDVTKRVKGSDSTYTRVAVVAPRRTLDFFANVDPARLLDVNECADNKCLVGENVFVGNAAADGSYLKPWNKSFEPKTRDNLQTSYHSVLTSAAWPGGGPAFDLRGYLLNSTYEQLGFLFNYPLPAGIYDAPAIPLANGAGSFAKYLIELRFSANQYWDVVGTSLTDYSRSLTVGRGAGSLFLQGHAAADWKSAPKSLTVPTFDLSLQGTTSIDNKTVWNIPQVTGMFMMSPPCGQLGQDARCKPSFAGITPAMRNGRSSSILRVITDPFAGGCYQPWGGDETQTTAVQMGPFARILDMTYDPASGGFFRTCPGGQWLPDRTCCLGQVYSGACETITTPGDFQRHVLYLKRTTWYPIDPACGTALQPSVERIPYWVFYSPGRAATIYAPDLPSNFPYACGGVDTAACATDQRMGLPQRMGSGRACSTGCKAGEVCTDAITGAKICAVDNGGGSYITEDYEWHVDMEAVDLVDNTQCRAQTPCTQSTRPVVTSGLDFPRFDGTFDFAQTTSCLTARSSNEFNIN